MWGAHSHSECSVGGIGIMWGAHSHSECSVGARSYV